MKQVAARAPGFSAYLFVLIEQNRRNSRSILSFYDGRTRQDGLKMRCKMYKLFNVYSWHVLTCKQLFQKVLCLEQFLTNTSDFLY